MTDRHHEHVVVLVRCHACDEPKRPDQYPPGSTVCRSCDTRTGVGERRRVWPTVRRVWPRRRPGIRHW